MHVRILVLREVEGMLFQPENNRSGLRGAGRWGTYLVREEMLYEEELQVVRTILWLASNCAGYGRADRISSMEPKQVRRQVYAESK